MELKFGSIQTTRDRLLYWNNYYTSDNFGIGVECTKCKKWRTVYEYAEEKDVPEDWHCAMSVIDNKKGKKRWNCSFPEVTKEDMYLVYKPAEVVWAKHKREWWPAIIEDHPDTGDYYWKSKGTGKNIFHVTFFGENAYRQCTPECSLDKFKQPIKQKYLKKKVKEKEFQLALKNAEAALSMTDKERLDTFSFAVLHKGKFPTLSSIRADEIESDASSTTKSRRGQKRSVKTKPSANKCLSSANGRKSVPSDSSLTPSVDPEEHSSLSSTCEEYPLLDYNALKASALKLQKKKKFEKRGERTRRAANVLRNKNITQNSNTDIAEDLSSDEDVCTVRTPHPPFHRKSACVKELKPPLNLEHPLAEEEVNVTMQNNRVEESENCYPSSGISSRYLPSEKSVHLRNGSDSPETSEKSATTDQQVPDIAEDQKFILDELVIDANIPMYMSYKYFTIIDF